MQTRFRRKRADWPRLSRPATESEHADGGLHICKIGRCDITDVLPRGSSLIGKVPSVRAAGDAGTAAHTDESSTVMISAPACLPRDMGWCYVIYVPR